MYLTTFLVYAGYKFNVLWTKTNPNITSTPITDYYSIEDVINTKQLGFKFAWGVESTYESSPMIDPKFVKWVATIVKDNDDSVINSKQLKFHRCTE